MVGKYNETTYEFDGVDELSNTVSTLEDTFSASKEKSDAKVLCMIDDGDEWLQDYDRTPLVVYEDGNPVNGAAVSKHDKYYTVTQFHEPFEALADALSKENINPNGHITIGQFRKRLTSQIEFSDVSITDPTGHDVELGMRINTAHNGFSAVSIEIGAERLVCSNGMTAWDSQFSYSHEHNQGPFNASLMFHAVESIIDNTDRIEERFERAHNQQLRSKDELFLLLLDCGIEWLFDDPLDALHESFNAEREWHNNPRQMEEAPSLYDAYTVGTYAIDHLADDQSSERALDTARGRLTTMLETYDGSIPSADELVSGTVERRTEAITSGEDLHCEGEREIVQSIARAI